MIRVGRLVPALLLLVAGPLAAQRGGCRDQPAAGSAIRVAPPEEPGEPLVVRGRILDAAGSPLAGVRVRVYHTDSEGFYSAHGMDESAARLCGVFASDREGRYEVTTIRPAPYASGAGPAPHLHFDVTLPQGGQRLFTLFPRPDGETGAAAAGDRRASVRPLVRGADGVWQVVYDLVAAPR